jgi:hypothetical protein
VHFTGAAASFAGPKVGEARTNCAASHCALCTRAHTPHTPPRPHLTSSIPSHQPPFPLPTVQASNATGQPEIDDATKAHRPTSRWTTHSSHCPTTASRPKYWECTRPAQPASAPNSQSARHPASDTSNPTPKIDQPISIKTIVQQPDKRGQLLCPPSTKQQSAFSNWCAF